MAEEELRELLPGQSNQLSNVIQEINPDKWRSGCLNTMSCPSCELSEASQVPLCGRLQNQHKWLNLHQKQTCEHRIHQILSQEIVEQNDKVGQMEQETQLIQNENYQLQIENFNFERNEGVEKNNTCKHCIEKFLITIEPKGTGKDILIIQNTPNGQFSDNGHHRMRFQLENCYDKESINSCEVIEKDTESNTEESEGEDRNYYCRNDLEEINRYCKNDLDDRNYFCQNSFEERSVFCQTIHQERNDFSESDFDERIICCQKHKIEEKICQKDNSKCGTSKARTRCFLQNDVCGWDTGFVTEYIVRAFCLSLLG